MLWKIDGYLAIPHEVLHVLAYWLTGKKCRYRVGDHFVHPLESRSFGERLFVLLFPLLIIGGAGLALMVWWAATYVSHGYPPHPLTYFLVAPAWHKALWSASVILLLYAGSCVGDVRVVIRLLFEHLRDQPPN